MRFLPELRDQRLARASAGEQIALIRHNAELAVRLIEAQLDTPRRGGDKPVSAEGRRMKDEGGRQKNEDENSEFSTSVENAFEQDDAEKGRRMKDEG